MSRNDRPRVRDEHEETLSLMRVIPIPSDSSGQPTAKQRRLRSDTPFGPVNLSPPHCDRATLTVVSGVDAGRVFLLPREETIVGRANGVTLQIDDPSISRRHARVVHTEEGQYFLEDLASKNGTFVNGHAVGRVPLTSGDRLQLGPDLLFQFALVDEREEALHRRLYESSTRDMLTGLTNRRRLFQRLEIDLPRAQADGNDTGLLMIDIDHFKQINDTYGHLAGDNVLRAFAICATTMFRARDLFARYGGEEFVAVVSCVTMEELVALAERLRVALAKVCVEFDGGSVSATVSVGVAMWSECVSKCASLNCLDLVALADERMYAAKQAGRNGVCFSAAPQSARGA
ncbi:MAG: diguanylate cyclase [Polyangiaceae bacterium]|jgi:two-component system, cell cycle response regulator